MSTLSCSRELYMSIYCTVCVVYNVACLNVDSYKKVIWTDDIHKENKYKIKITDLVCNDIIMVYLYLQLYLIYIFWLRNKGVTTQRNSKINHSHVRVKHFRNSKMCFASWNKFLTILVVGEIATIVLPYPIYII